MPLIEGIDIEYNIQTKKIKKRKKKIFHREGIDVYG